MSNPVRMAWVLLCALATIACGEIEEDAPVAPPPEFETAEQELIWLEALGERLFVNATFGGNGRTCAACHTPETGTISPAEIQARFDADPDDPLFRALDSDDGVSTSFIRLIAHGTVRVNMPLPPNVRLADDPEARSVVLHRAIPTTLNSPGLDPVVMLDGRQPDIVAQAGAAVVDHYEAPRLLRGFEMRAIAAFETTRAFFSADVLWDYFNGGPPPGLPEGRTAAEQRGRRFFEDTEEGLCAHCHGGPLLNETNAFFAGPLPPGSRFTSVAVSEFNRIGNPVHRFVFEWPVGSGQEVTVVSPDPGRALVTGNPADANQFKIPSMWGVARTGPFFHDNSARTLEEVMNHYQAIMALPPINIVLTDQDKADIIAYLHLLDTDIGAPTGSEDDDSDDDDSDDD